MSSIPGSVGYISYPMFIEPTIARVPSGFSGYIWLDTKIVLKKERRLNREQRLRTDFQLSSFVYEVCLWSAVVV